MKVLMTSRRKGWTIARKLPRKRQNPGQIFWMHCSIYCSKVNLKHCKLMHGIRCHGSSGLVKLMEYLRSLWQQGLLQMIDMSWIVRPWRLANRPVQIIWWISIAKHTIWRNYTVHWVNSLQCKHHRADKTKAIYKTKHWTVQYQQIQDR